MDPHTNIPSRRRFLERLGGTGAALALSACATTTVAPAHAASGGAWDVSWVDRIRRARHRAVFDETQGETALMLAARYLENVAAVYGVGTPDVIAVLNLRVRAVHVALNHAIWQKYPIGEDAHVKDAVTGAPARRNVNYAPEPGASEAYAAMTLERLHGRGTLVLVCDFALGHLATRLATTVGMTSDAVHGDLRGGLVPGAVTVPSGLFGLGEAQNAGCAFVPSAA